MAVLVLHSQVAAATKFGIENFGKITELNWFDWFLLRVCNGDPGAVYSADSISRTSGDPEVLCFKSLHPAEYLLCQERLGWTGGQLLTAITQSRKNWCFYSKTTNKFTTS